MNKIQNQHSYAPVSRHLWSPCVDEKHPVSTKSTRANFVPNFAAPPARSIGAVKNRGRLFLKLKNASKEGFRRHVRETPLHTKYTHTVLTGCFFGLLIFSFRKTMKI